MSNKVKLNGKSKEYSDGKLPQKEETVLSSHVSTKSNSKVSAKQVHNLRAWSEENKL